jgi:hypothetical protein
MPDPSALPVDLRGFIARNIVSLDQLAILLAMQADTDRWWTRELAADLVGVPADDCEQMLLDLTDCGIAAIRQNQSRRLFRFAPHDARIAELVERLATVNRDQRVLVAQELSKQAIERIRREARRTFSSVLPEADEGERK